MSLIQFITKIKGCKSYYRGLIVRAIEDFIILFLMGVTVWSLAWVIGGVLKLMGVA